MSKKSIISLVIILIGVTSLVLWSKSAEKGDLSASELVANSHPARIGGSLSASEIFYDFGKISMKNGDVSKTFTVANPTNEDIKISNLSSSCMCTNAYILNSGGSRKGLFGMPGHGGAATRANEIVKAGESVGIEVVYDPNAHGPAGVGAIDRFVYLEDENGNNLQFEIKANVTP